MKLADIIELIVRLLPWLCALLMLLAFIFETIDALHRITREKEQRAQANKMTEGLYAKGEDGVELTHVSNGNDEPLRVNYTPNDRVHDTFDFEDAFIRHEAYLLLETMLMEDTDSIGDATDIGVLGRGYLDTYKRRRIAHESEAFYPDDFSTGLTPDAWSVAPVIGAIQQ